MPALFDLDYLYKIVYPEGLIRPTFQNAANSFLALVPKNTKGTGETWQISSQISSGGGASASFTKAQANSNGSKGRKFLVEGTRRDYSVEQIDGGRLLSSQNDIGALEDLYTNALLGSQEKMQKSLGHAVWGTGSGSIAKIIADLGGGTFSYDDPRGSVFFDEGQVLQSALLETGGVVDAGTALITGIDRENQIVTYTASGGWAPVANHYLYRDGDYDAKITGIKAWIPSVTPVLGDNFFGVDRSRDTIKLAGIRVDQTAATSHREALTRAQKVFQRYGIAISHAFCSPDDFNQFAVEYQGIARLELYYVDVMTGKMTKALDSKGQGVRLAIEALVLPGGAMLLQDQWAPVGLVHYFTMSTWELRTVGDCPHFVGTETGEPKGILRLRDGEDTWEVRARMLGNLLCHDPSKNGVILMPALA